MKYRDFDYGVVQSVEEPDAWRWTVWENDKPIEGVVRGSRQRAIALAQLRIDALADGNFMLRTSINANDNCFISVFAVEDFNIEALRLKAAALRLPGGTERSLLLQRSKTFRMYGKFRALCFALDRARSLSHTNSSCL
jgi:hypothetical protein